MEVDAPDEDSDATVAGEEEGDPPTSASGIPRLTDTRAAEKWTCGGQRPVAVAGGAAAHAYGHIITDAMTSSRASDGEDGGPSSPSLLRGSTVSQYDAKLRYGGI